LTPQSQSEKKIFHSKLIQLNEKQQQQQQHYVYHQHNLTNEGLSIENNHRLLYFNFFFVAFENEFKIKLYMLMFEDGEEGGK
ncbi:hypothetical protein DERF_010137, partial [Dermatophagoides farinae]